MKRVAILVSGLPDNYDHEELKGRVYLALLDVSPNSRIEDLIESGAEQQTTVPDARLEHFHLTLK